MTKMILYWIGLSGLVLLCCSTKSDEWRPWYEWRGSVDLCVLIEVNTMPQGAEVYLDQVYQGKTPLVLQYRSFSAVSGWGRDRGNPWNGRTDTSESRFLERHCFDILLRLSGYKIIERTLTLEDYFQQADMVHGKQYAMRVVWNLDLKKQRWFR